MNPPLILSVTEYRFGLKFTVQGETDRYIIRYDENKGWFCPCLDYYFRNHVCKHIRACIDFIYDLYGVRLPDNVWCDDPKSEIIVNAEVGVRVIKLKLVYQLILIY